MPEDMTVRNRRLLSRRPQNVPCDEHRDAVRHNIMEPARRRDATRSDIRVPRVSHVSRIILVITDATVVRSRRWLHAVALQALCFYLIIQSVS